MELRENILSYIVIGGLLMTVSKMEMDGRCLLRARIDGFHPAAVNEDTRQRWPP